MTELQKVEFNLLCEFIKICEDLSLTYYLVCGTALGAVKYQGFIPWDDDVDVALPRKDYETFLKKAPELLPKEYFLQNSETDSNYPFIYSKLRDSQTTYIEKNTALLPINHGVYIDIFPLDGYPKDGAEAKTLEQKKLLYTLQSYSCLNIERKWKADLFNRVLRFFGYHRKTSKVVKKYTDLISKYDIESSDLICNHGNWQGKLEYAPKEQYGNGEYVLFESLKVRVPEKYDDYLTQKYGDWRADLPKEQQVGHHYYEICDLDKPYTHYYMPKN